MKASLKFREDQKPLFRAKVPLSIVGFPFQSGIVAGESKELSLNLSTFFDSGPSFKIAYRPNDSANPFSLVCKTGIGRFGSPISSSMTMSAEFRLIGNQNPSFFVHFKPQFGDFSIKKSQSSVFVKDGNSNSKLTGVASLHEQDDSMEMVEKPTVQIGYMADDGLFSSRKRVEVLSSESSLVDGVLKSVLTGAEVSARTAVPLRSRALVNFRWGVRLPAEAEDAVIVKSKGRAGISFRKFPLLVLNKIGIEHVAKDDSKDGKNLNLPRNADLTEACLSMKKQLEAIQAENGMLRKSMDDLKSEIVAGKLSSWGGGVDAGMHREGETGGVKPLGGGRVERRNNGDKKSSESSGFGGKVAVGDASEELKKALMGASGA